MISDAERYDRVDIMGNKKFAIGLGDGEF